MNDPRISAAIAVVAVRATLEEADGRWVLGMQRSLGYPPELVWSMLTDPRQLERWSPIVPDRALTGIGPAHAQEAPTAPVVDAEVLVADAPSELVHRWGTHVLRWQLVPSATGTTLTLTETLDERDDGHRNAAGWHICLAVLTAVLDSDAGLDGMSAGVERAVGPDALSYGWADLDRAYADVI